MGFLAKALPRHLLEEALARALAIGYGEYRGRVIEFLGETDRSKHAAEDTWDEMRLRAAALIESVLQREEQE